MDYDIEPYAGGFIIADYSGNRGHFGAAYAGVSLEWNEQPTVGDPFPTEAAARQAAADQADRKATTELGRRLYEAVLPDRENAQHWFEIGALARHLVAEHDKAGATP
ncbi:hypothetical protein [Nocardia gipuzkoensis]|uniref:hypothetical protein n=1 Tax=Nocardia gipuzkoensis TaxID=2749991 RepID=UPI00237EBDEB|nr:hypothetical protein [Nocardia gipuzkoensis]MDE1673814.1 hypothetical protein [Nocardia gipuzkoensis]